jgi:hypothetical protein
MGYPLYRRGTFAVLDGESYPVSYRAGADEVRFSDGGPAPVQMCERVFSVQVYATYRGHGVLVDDVDFLGTAHIMEAEWDGDWATENGFVQANAYEYFKKVGLRELRNYYEKQSDLLFPRWRETRFARPVEGHPLRAEWTFDTSVTVDGRPRSGILAGEDGRVAAVTTRAEYLGYPCEIAGIAADGSVAIHSLSADEAQAEVDGFTLAANGRWAKTVHIYDLARYHEHHADLLFDQWRGSA